MLVKNDLADARVSVIIPARDARHTIGGTLRSLLSAATLIEEVIVVDDASTDGTGKAAVDEGTRLELPVRVLRSSAGNPGAARNVGIEAARAALIYFIDADDEHTSGGIEGLHELLVANSDCGIAVGAFVREEDGRTSKVKRPPRYSKLASANARGVVDGSLRSSAIGSALFRRDAIGPVRFPEATAYDEDTIFLANVLARTNVIRSRKVVARYRVDSSRAEERFSFNPRRSFLEWRRALRRGGFNGTAAKRREGLIALSIARATYLRGDAAAAARFVRVALAAPLSLRDRLRARRYRAKIQRLGRVAMRGAESTLPERAIEIFPRPNATAVVTVEPSSSPVSGGELRNWSIAEAARSCGETMLLSVGVSPREGNVDGIDVRSLSPANPGEIYRRPAGGTAIDVTIPEGTAERLRARLLEFRPSTVVVESIVLHPLLQVARVIAPRLILDLHNIESDVVAQLRSSPRARAFGHAARRVAEVRAIERQAVGIADEVWVCSDADAARLRKLVGADTMIRVVPNAIPRVDTIARDRRGSSGAGPTLLFLGHLSYPPNVRAATKLAREILPGARSRLPNCRLAIAGRAAKPRVLALAGDDVQVQSDPAEVSGLLATADLVVLPIEMGGGTRIKAIEAAAWGIPLIGTVRAVEGLGFVDGKTVRLAETADEFVEAIASLWNDRDRYERQSRSARDYVFAHFGPDAIAAAVRPALLKGGGGL